MKKNPGRKTRRNQIKARKREEAVAKMKLNNNKQKQEAKRK